MTPSFIKSIAPRLTGKVVEISQGMVHEIIKYGEKEIQRKTVISGLLLECLDECIVLEVEDSGIKAIVYINSWSIQTIMELKYGLNIFDIYNPDERKNTK